MKNQNHKVTTNDNFDVSNSVVKANVPYHVDLYLVTRTLVQS